MEAKVHGINKEWICVSYWEDDILCVLNIIV